MIGRIACLKHVPHFAAGGEGCVVVADVMPNSGSQPSFDVEQQLQVERRHERRQRVEHVEQRADGPFADGAAADGGPEADRNREQVAQNQRRDREQQRGRDALEDQLRDGLVVLRDRAAEVDAQDVAEPDEVGLVPGLVEAVEAFPASRYLTALGILPGFIMRQVGGERRAGDVADQRVDEERRSAAA